MFELPLIFLQMNKVSVSKKVMAVLERMKNSAPFEKHFSTTTFGEVNKSTCGYFTGWLLQPKVDFGRMSLRESGFQKRDRVRPVTELNQEALL